MSDNPKKTRPKRRKPQGKKKLRSPKREVAKGSGAGRSRSLDFTTDRGTGALAAGSKGAGSGDDNASFDFADFFLKVGKGLVDAQRKMDSESLVYLQEVSSQPHVLPTIFRIPKLSANVKFALTQEQDKSVGIIFYKDETKAQTLNQQSVEFDIVSVPAPAQLSSPLSVTLILSKTQRQEILKAVGDYRVPGDTTGANTEARLGLRAALANPDQIIIYSPSVEGNFYLAFANADLEQNVGFWFAILNSSPSQVLAIRKYGDVGAAGLVSLRDFILAQGRKQAEFLSRTGLKNG
jgi:hypothetical protein